MSLNASPSSSTKCAAWAVELERGRQPSTHPIEIPAPAAVSRGARAVVVERREASHWEDAEGRWCGDDDGEVVLPPHELLARRRAAFSMCSGQGRTLKGRDLRRVRDSVLRMTGFIES